MSLTEQVINNKLPMLIPCYPKQAFVTLTVKSDLLLLAFEASDTGTATSALCWRTTMRNFTNTAKHVIMNTPQKEKNYQNSTIVQKTF